jgi:2-oxoglutarate/2-oxoacid ferredoxin oxidoreductase subunit alpha
VSTQQDLSLFIVGAAGEGIQTIGDVVAHALLRFGVPVFTYQDYESRIRGGHSSYRIRAAGPNVPRHDADVLLALNPAAAEQYASALSKDGIVLGELPSGRSGTALPFQTLAKERFGAPIFANAIAAGAVGAALGLSDNILVASVRERLAKLSNEMLQQNEDAVRLGHAMALEQLGPRDTFPWTRTSETHAFVSTHSALAVAAAAAGCRFMAAYPMSPSTGIMTAMAKEPELGVFVEQAEDEIAAVNMAIGASAAGARAMTATSGGGFALMTEGVSLAGMTETPLVVVISQRPGPATGLPTRTAQEDLFFTIFGGHGEFARAVLAPSDPQEAVHLIQRAFDWSERYQMPVLLLTDQMLADAHFSLRDLEIPSPSETVGLADPERIDNYARYRLTEDGVSPRLALGQSRHLVCIDSDEHDEAGHITEDLETLRPAMVEKRLEKMRRLQREVPAPAPYRVEDAEIVLLSWGSTRHAVQEAVDRLRARGQAIGSLHFTHLWPLPSLSLSERPSYWTVEGNATGQLARLLQGEGGIRISVRIQRYDGLPWDAASLMAEIENDGKETTV